MGGFLIAVQHGQGFHPVPPVTLCFREVLCTAGPHQKDEQDGSQEPEGGFVGIGKRVDNPSGKQKKPALAEGYGYIGYQKSLH